MDQNSEFSDLKNELIFSIISKLPIGLLLADMESKFVVINSLAKKMLGIKADSIIHKDMHHILFDFTELNDAVKNYYKKGKKNFIIKKINFNDQILRISGSSINNDLLMIIEDITETVQIEKELINSAIISQEEERRRIAKEIHDGIGPLLSTIKLNIQSLSSEGSLTNEQNEQLDNTIQILDNVTDDLRSLSHALMPKILEDFGLVAAIEDQIGKLTGKKRNIINFYQTLENERFDRMIELNMYRIFQELLNNALKHANASKIHVQLIRHSDSIILMVEDDGIGFEYLKTLTETPGMGLMNIESRTKAIGGILTFDASSNFGVNCIIEVPLNS